MINKQALIRHTDFVGSNLQEQIKNG
ncbi:uncharacterized protein METZ01_LOCUS170679 [marine metagenome]|uniref:Uncharacterized protein n=1 Tax=marine metagenome TaxID=408172 RepID=A0A382BVK9_9ZZZZ